MDRPRTSRPPESASTDAACLASSTAGRSGPIATIVTSEIRPVTAAAAASPANGSNESNTIRSRTPSEENGPSSASRAHGVSTSPPPGTVFGSPIPIRTGPDVTQWAPMTTAEDDQVPQRTTPAAIVVQRRIEWPDTDASGNYHNTAAFRFIEVAETALFERLGLLHDVYGRLPRAHIEADFRWPLVFRDVVDISLRVS